jgi:putative endonuclease
MRWTYTVECRDGTFYVGSTVDLERRVSEHDLGFGAKCTRPRSRRPVRLVWSSEFNRMDEAFWYEKQIQGWGPGEAHGLDRRTTRAAHRSGSEQAARGGRAFRLAGLSR